ncbi:MAG: phosphatidate cytidylyltransferase, partial [Snowella sp.]
MPWTRIISTIVAIAIALAMLILGGWYFTVAIGLIIFQGQKEYFQLVQAKGIEPAGKTTIVLSLMLLICATLSPDLT